jgi:hypothetical protein
MAPAAAQEASRRTTNIRKKAFHAAIQRSSIERLVDREPGVAYVLWTYSGRFSI